MPSPRVHGDPEATVKYWSTRAIGPTLGAGSSRPGGRSGEDAIWSQYGNNAGAKWCPGSSVWDIARLRNEAERSLGNHLLLRPAPGASIGPGSRTYRAGPSSGLRTSRSDSRGVLRADTVCRSPRSVHIRSTSTRLIQVCSSVAPLCQRLCSAAAAPPPNSSSSRSATEAAQETCAGVNTTKRAWKMFWRRRYEGEVKCRMNVAH